MEFHSDHQTSQSRGSAVPCALLFPASSASSRSLAPEGLGETRWSYLFSLASSLRHRPFPSVQTYMYNIMTHSYPIHISFTCIYYVTLVTRCSLQCLAHQSLQCNLYCSCHQAWAQGEGGGGVGSMQISAAFTKYLLNSITPLPVVGSSFMYTSHHSIIAGIYSYSISMAATSDMPRQYLYANGYGIKIYDFDQNFENIYRSFSDSRVDTTPLISSMTASFKATPLKDTPTSCLLSSTR